MVRLHELYNGDCAYVRWNFGHSKRQLRSNALKLILAVMVLMGFKMSASSIVTKVKAEFSVNRCGLLNTSCSIDQPLQLERMDKIEMHIHTIRLSCQM